MRPQASGTLAVFALAVLALPPSSSAQEKRFTISAGGGLTFGTLSWSRSTTWDVYQEKARLDSDHEAKTGPGFEGAISYRITRRLGVRAAYGWSSRDASATLHAEIPHPFFFETPRTIDTSLSGLDYSEKSAHLDVEVWPVVGRFELGLFGGVALVSVEADLVEQVAYDEEYPYDEVTYRSATMHLTSSDNAVGWSAGAVLGYTFAPRWGIAVRARYTKATVELTPPGDETTRLDTGGFRAMAELRFGF